MKIEDEDYAYEKRRQQRLDEGEVKPARKLVRISACSDIRPQRYANRDPWPQVPFEHELTQMPKQWEVWAFLAAVGAVYVVLYLLVDRLFGWLS